MKTNIGILGSNGFVGKILKQYYPNAIGYDIQGECDKLEDVLNRDIVFVAINLLDNCLSETSLQLLYNYFEKMKDGTIVVIKSTFVPGTADKIQNKFPMLKVVYNCEFLSEATAWEDFIHPHFQILGVTHQSIDTVNELFAILPDAPIKRVISIKDAEVLKHVKNSYYALKVAFFNQLFDACSKIGADYETVKEILTHDKWIGDSHNIIWHKSYRGFGTPKISKCLPKDLTNLLKMVKFPLLEETERYNNELNKQQGL